VSSTAEARGLTADPLFVAATRPAMALGVPYAAILANAFVTLELFLVTRNLLWLLVAAPVHGVAWLVCLAEPRAFELLALWAQVRARAGFRGRRPWRAVSYGPFPSPAGRTAQVPCAIVEARETR
jgi:type IV secretion system protein VirB3